MRAKSLSTRTAVGFSFHYLEEFLSNLIFAKVVRESTCTDFQFVSVYVTSVGAALLSLCFFDYFLVAFDLTSV